MGGLSEVSLSGVWEAPQCADSGESLAERPLRVENGPVLISGLDSDLGLRISDFLSGGRSPTLLSVVSCQLPRYSSCNRSSMGAGLEEGLDGSSD